MRLCAIALVLALANALPTDDGTDDTNRQLAKKHGGGAKHGGDDEATALPAPAPPAPSAPARESRGRGGHGGGHGGTAVPPPRRHTVPHGVAPRRSAR